MKRILTFILLAINLFGTGDLNAQNLKFNESKIEYGSNGKVKVKLYREIVKAQIHCAYTKYSESTEEKNNENLTETAEKSIKKIIERKDSSYIYLRSGAHWYINKEPKKPLFYPFMVLINSKNEKVVNYYHFVVFCNYFKKNGKLNYDEIDYISINKEAHFDNGEKSSDKFNFRFSSDGKPILN